MILVFPTATAVTKPVEEIVAIVGSELAQTTLEDTTADVPSEYVPMAKNCVCEPTEILAEGTDINVIADKLGEGIDVVVIVDVFVEQDVITKVETHANNMVRQ